MYLNNVYHKEKPWESIYSLFDECNQMIKILNNTKHKYLYKYMIELFNNKENCNDYGILADYLVYSNRYKIIYGDKEITSRISKTF